MSKSILNIIDCDLKKDQLTLIIFGVNIFDSTYYQMTVLDPTSPNVCFCTTQENPKRRNRIKNVIFCWFCFSRQCRNKQRVQWKTGQSFDRQLCQKYWCQKLSKSGNPCLSYNRKCPGCFFSGHSVVLNLMQSFYSCPLL